MGKPAKAVASRTAAQRRVRGSIPASPPNESALGYLANENASRSSLLFPVMIITGISDVNDINDLRVFITAVIPQTLHLVVGTPPAPRRAACRAASGQPERSPAGRLALGKFPGFSGLGTGRGGYSRFPTPHVQNAIVCVHIAIFTRSILYSKYYTFQE